jgi:hypothetical protein
MSVKRDEKKAPFGGLTDSSIVVCPQPRPSFKSPAMQVERPPPHVRRAIDLIKPKNLRFLGRRAELQGRLFNGQPIIIEQATCRSDRDFSAFPKRQLS